MPLRKAAIGIEIEWRSPMENDQPMRNPKALAAALCFWLLCPAELGSATSIPDVKIDIPYKRFVLTNGLK